MSPRNGRSTASVKDLINVRQGRAQQVARFDFMKIDARTRSLNLPLLIGCLFPLFMTSPAHAATQQVHIPEKYKGVILHAPEPEYPLALERQTVRDQGVYRLKINQQTGGVDEVGVLTRCYDRRLDGASVMAFFQWKFKPGALKQMDIPVVYERFVRVLLDKAGSR
jgi:hypothetical protein